MPSQKIVVPDDSLKALFLETYYANNLDEQHFISTGTGFYYKSPTAGAVFLVTARHVVTARAWRDGHFIGREPNGLRVHGHIRADDGSAVMYDAETKSIVDAYYDVPLFDLDSEGAEIPRWLEHPDLGKDFDVVALPVTPPSEFHCAPYQQADDYDLSLTDELFIVGYPYGLRGHILPIWVRGTIASLPGLGYDGFPLFLIDSRTRQGQSGAPVIRYLKEGTIVGHPMAPMGQTATIVDGDLSKLVGVYTGRVNRTKTQLPPHEVEELRRGSTDLGLVWWVPELERLCTSGVKPSGVI
mgnify:CR=1 FL=1